MARPNDAYWSRRIKLLEDSLKDRSYSYVENMERQFMAAQAQVERELAVWYQRFAANNEITLADAKRLLTGGELAEFRWTVGEYIAYGQQNAIDGAWMKQLENASARVHISRLEAIKLQIQQQAEVLYANQLNFVDSAAREIYLGSYYGTAFELQRGLGVSWTMQAVNESTITKVLSRPWTTDGQTFRDRCWTNKQALVNSVNTQLTQMIIRGEAPDKAISAISRQFKVSRDKAGRLIMTEAAAFSSAAQKDSFTELGVERYKIVASFDGDICELCGTLDGQVFKLSDYQVGLTAPPFHPWCRCCTCPYFDDMAKLGERWTRNPDDTTEKVPADMSFEEWKGKFVKEPHEDDLTCSTAGSIMDKIEKKEGTSVVEWESLGSIDTKLLKGRFGELNTDEIIVTHERVGHIKDRHPGDFDLFEQYGTECVQAPDFIIEDIAHVGTVFMVKKLPDTNLNVVVRLSLETDEKHLKNSVMTFYRMRERNLKKLIQKNHLLYKKE